MTTRTLQLIPIASLSLLAACANDPGTVELPGAYSTPLSKDFEPEVPERCLSLFGEEGETSTGIFMSALSADPSYRLEANALEWRLWRDGCEDWTMTSGDSYPIPGGILLLTFDGCIAEWPEVDTTRDVACIGIANETLEVTIVYAGEWSEERVVPPGMEKEPPRDYSDAEELDTRRIPDRYLHTQDWSAPALTCPTCATEAPEIWADTMCAVGTLFTDLDAPGVIRTAPHPSGPKQCFYNGTRDYVSVSPALENIDRVPQCGVVPEAGGLCDPSMDDACRIDACLVECTPASDSTTRWVKACREETADDAEAAP